MEQSIYLLLDSKGSPIARGRIQGRTDGPYWQIQVEDGKIDEILEHKKLKLLSIMDSGPSYEGTIVRSRNDMIQLEVSKLDRHRAVEGQAGDRVPRSELRRHRLVHRPLPPGGGAAGGGHPRHQRAAGGDVPSAAHAPHRAGGGPPDVRRQIRGSLQRRGDAAAGVGVQPPAPGQAENKLSAALSST